MTETTSNIPEEILSFFTILDAIDSIEEADSLSRSDMFDGCMALFLSDQGLVRRGHTQRKECASKIRNLKHRLHPLQTSREAQELVKKYQEATLNVEAKQALQVKYIQLSQQLLESEEGCLYTRVSNLLDRRLAPILKLDQGVGRSNRARRAKKAESVLTQNAGLSGYTSSNNESTGNERNAVDRHGNRIGSEWDLGKDGAFDGLKGEKPWLCVLSYRKAILNQLLFTLRS